MTKLAAVVVAVGAAAETVAVVAAAVWSVLCAPPDNGAWHQLRYHRSSYTTRTCKLPDLSGRRCHR